MRNKDTLVLPVTTIIETGNHIAHIGNGNVRRNIAGKFGEYLRKTAEEEAPWMLCGEKFDKAELLYLAENIEDCATREIGIGDMAIVYIYEHYKTELPAVGNIMIWSTAAHLKEYHEEDTYRSRRRKNSV